MPAKVGVDREAAVANDGVASGGVDEIQRRVPSDDDDPGTCVLDDFGVVERKVARGYVHPELAGSRDRQTRDVEGVVRVGGDREPGRPAFLAREGHQLGAAAGEGEPGVTGVEVQVLRVGTRGDRDLVGASFGDDRQRIADLSERRGDRAVAVGLGRAVDV